MRPVRNHEECAAGCRRLLHEVTVLKLACLQGQATQEAVYQAADRYLEMLREYKRLKQDKKLRIPHRSQIVNWA